MNNLKNKYILNMNNFKSPITFIFRKFSKCISKDGEHLTSSFNHRVIKGTSLVNYASDNLKVIINNKDNNAIEEIVYFRGKSRKFEKFYVSYLFNVSGRYTLEVLNNNFVQSSGKEGEHEYKIKILVDVIE
jgi:hypothetical protein